MPRYTAHTKHGGVTSLSVLAMAASLVAAAGCRPNDLGTHCQLSRPICVAHCDDPQLMEVELEEFDPEDRTKDYITIGTVGCEQFTCVSSANFQGVPYCSRQCLSDDQCKGGAVDLVCRELVLDEQFIKDLCAQIGEERCEEIFGGVQSPKYCVVPPADYDPNAFSPE